MKKLGYYSILVLFLTACEQVIDLPLKSVDPMLVIEGTIHDNRSTQLVVLSRSTPFHQTAERQMVSGADVYVQSANGQRVLFEETHPGYYVARSFRGVSGVDYRLLVTYDGKQYEAHAALPHKVSIDSVGFSEATFLDRSFRSINILLQDPPEEENFYRFLVQPFHSKERFSFVYSDKYNNGKQVVYTLNTMDMELQPRDSVLVELQVITKPIYQYWRAIQDQNPGAASPGNPVSNISNGALGYFSAQAVEQIKIVVE